MPRHCRVEIRAERVSLRESDLVPWGLSPDELFRGVGGRLRRFPAPVGAFQPSRFVTWPVHSKFFFLSRKLQTGIVLVCGHPRVHPEESATIRRPPSGPRNRAECAVFAGTTLRVPARAVGWVKGSTHSGQFAAAVAAWFLVHSETPLVCVQAQFSCKLGPQTDSRASCGGSSEIPTRVLP